MMELLLKAVLLLTIVCVGWSVVGRAAECSGKPDPNAQPNLNPIYAQPPVFVTSVPNGKLYHVGEGDDMIPVVHLFGTPYQKGYAHGQLMKTQAQVFFNQTWQYFLNQVEQGLNGSLPIPQQWIDLISEIGLVDALDITFKLTEHFTGSYFYEEMRGLADASDTDYDTIRRVHMIGELTRGSCSMYGAWGNATAQMGGTLMQLRALDWAVDGPFKNFPQLTVYHATGNASDGSSFMNIGWTGWLGSITGISANQMAISEIGVAFPDSTFGEESRIGIPFTNILRDVIQFDHTLDDSINRIKNANRTCDLILGVGDGKSAGFRGIEYSYSTANFYDDTDMQPTADWHPRISNVVYYGMDWLCPGFNSVLATQLNKHYGNITAVNTIQDITAIVQTGDLHVAIYDLANMIVHVANARADNESGPDYAYDRTFIQLDMKSLFAEAPPMP